MSVCVAESVSPVWGQSCDVWCWQAGPELCRMGLCSQYNAMYYDWPMGMLGGSAFVLATHYTIFLYI